MVHAHLQALQKKHEELEKQIHRENSHAARNDVAIRRLKEQKLHIKEQIERLDQNRAAGR
ncbi:MAG: DUF465 domain-containing protein [Alphaproteobacteria bacterium]|nr:DUF465 domain-containing protein [Alphaproteobacteria bacterium]